MSQYARLGGPRTFSLNDTSPNGAPISVAQSKEIEDDSDLDEVAGTETGPPETAQKLKITKRTYSVGCCALFLLFPPLVLLGVSVTLPKWIQVGDANDWAAQSDIGLDGVFQSAVVPSLLSAGDDVKAHVVPLAVFCLAALLFAVVHSCWSRFKLQTCAATALASCGAAVVALEAALGYARETAPFRDTQTVPPAWTPTLQCLGASFIIFLVAGLAQSLVCALVLLKNFVPHARCFVVSAPLWYMVIAFLKYRNASGKITALEWAGVPPFSAGYWILGAVVWYMVYLTECYCAGTRKHLQRLPSADTIDSTIERARRLKPTMVLSVSCYHFETRTRTVTSTTVVNGQSQTSTRLETYTVRVPTHSESVIFPFTDWRDVSGTTNSTPAHPLCKLTFSRTIRIGDAHTQQLWNRASSSLQDRNRHRDTHMDYLETMELGKEFHATQICFSYKAARISIVCVGVVPYALFSVAGLSWPYRLALAAISANRSFELIKEITQRA